MWALTDHLANSHSFSRNLETLGNLGSFELGSIGVVGVLLLVIAIFAFIAFIKGLAKTVLALINLGVGGAAAFWGYNHGPSWLSQYWPKVLELDFANIIMASFCGAIVFWALFKIFSFLANPFQDSKSMEKCGFGLPAALICIPIAATLVFFTINRLRTTDELNHLKSMMTHQLEPEASRSGIHQMVMKKLQGSKLGQLILDYDPLWESDKAKLAKLAIIYHHGGPNALQENENITEILNHPTFKSVIMENAEVKKAISDSDPSMLWDSDALSAASNNESLKALIKRVTFE